MIRIENFTDKAEIYIYGNIVDDTDAAFIKSFDDDTLGFEFPSKIREQLDGIKGIPVTVHIASDGGSVSAGVAIYNLLSRHDAPVTVVVDGWAASIASFIAFAGQKIIMPENTFLMIHNPKCEVFGDSEYLRNVAGWLDKTKTMLSDTYSKHLKTDTVSVSDLMDNETWLTASEAAEMFDNVEMVEPNDVRMVAEFKTEFSSAPDVLKNKVVDTVDDDVDDKDVDADRVEDKKRIIETLMKSLQEDF